MRKRRIIAFASLLGAMLLLTGLVLYGRGEPVPVTGQLTLQAVAAIQQEYPNDLRHRMDGPGDRPRPGEVHPAFYGCYDWHSNVHGHWLLVRLVRLFPVVNAIQPVHGPDAGEAAFVPGAIPLICTAAKRFLLGAYEPPNVVAIRLVAEYGNDATVPKPMYFALWDNRRAYFCEEPDLSGTPSWRIFMKDFANGKGLSLSRTRSNVWNKIQVIFDDPDIGTTFTDWAENKDSQRLFGVREGNLTIGSSVLAIAEVIRDLAINAYAFPDQSSKISISGRVYNAAGARDYPWLVRAGSLIQVMDYDPSVAQLVGGSSGLDSATMFISRTSYNADSNTVDLELGRRNVVLDLIMARLGYNGSGIQ